MSTPADLAATDDIEFGVRLLAATPTHEGRDRGLLLHWATAATAFGAGLTPAPSRARVVERDGGLEHGLLARYTSRPATVELYTDTLARAEALVDELGWRHWYPTGSVRAAALAHEAVHELLHHGPVRAALKQALGHVVLRAGRLRLYGHVAGAEEIAAHAHARTACGLGRSPLLLTAALARADAHPTTAPHGREK
ncbi:MULTISPECIES: hypothetical protein [unclassified Streptomyces]|uniref:hypothetical protein n=1 Tax=unclassified Streptomyces TaxID=2593676 RepID=UPI0011E7155B|nr:hypothetical protein [Streptomyces sp. sk2.1]TXS65904.1 hypothetical protein EAO76_36975 [Streptomyces sp. sk2.1]